MAATLPLSPGSETMAKSLIRPSRAIHLSSAPDSMRSAQDGISTMPGAGARVSPEVFCHSSKLVFARPERESASRSALTIT